MRARDGSPLDPHLHRGALVLSLRVPPPSACDFGTLAGFEALPTNEVVDLSRKNGHPASRFFKQIKAKAVGGQGAGGQVDFGLTLEKDRFYILATKEKVSVPTHLSAEMVPFSSHVGELRVHYAGFFDPGFGFGARGEVPGAVGVLEVRPHETVTIYDGQPIALMEYFRNAKEPERPYGAVGNTYQGQGGPRLAKYFTAT